MKKAFFSAVLALLLATSSYAGETGKVNSKVMSNFPVEFSKAKNVSWTSTQDYVKASFNEDEKSKEAYYDRDGNLLGVTSWISIDELPISAKRSFAKKYADFTATELIKLDGTDETTYYISAKNDSKSLILKVSAEGFLSVVKWETK
jgi:hypothetical protein